MHRLQQIDAEMNVELVIQRDVVTTREGTDARTFNDVWLCWSFQANIMYSLVLYIIKRVFLKHFLTYCYLFNFVRDLNQLI